MGQLAQASSDLSQRLAAIATILAVLLYVYMGLTVSMLRDQYHVAPPGTAGPPEFERAFRAHQNMLEALPVFLSTLWIAAIYFRPAPWLPATVALAWIAGRYLYMRGYIMAADRRGAGLMVQSLAMVVNLGLAIAGTLLQGRS